MHKIKLYSLKIIKLPQNIQKAIFLISASYEFRENLLHEKSYDAEIYENFIFGVILLPHEEIELGVLHFNFCMQVLYGFILINVGIQFDEG